MTDQQLLALFHARKAAWEATESMPPDFNSNPEQAREVCRRMDAPSASFRAADRAITAELVARGKPAKLDGVTLHLTFDRLNFVALRPGTTTPLVWCPGTGRRAGEELKRIQNVLLDYRKAAPKRQAGAGA